MVNQRGRIAWQQVATFLRVDTKSIRRWLDPTDLCYHEEFAEEIAKLTEEIDTGRTKRSQLTVSQKHNLHRRNYAMVDVGPMKPMWAWTKKVLLRYAAEILGLTLPARITKSELQYDICYALADQTARKKVETTSTVQEVDPNQDAVKVILKNLGDPKHRWNLKDEIEGGPLTSINIQYVELDEDPNAGKKIDDAPEIPT